MMVQQTIDSKFSEYGLGNTETNLSTHDKQFPVPVAVKKMALRDVQNENRIPNTTGRSPISKNIGQTMDSFKVSGNKRNLPEDPVSPPQLHSPTNHLVYVRRRSDAEILKSSACNSRDTNSDCLDSSQPGRSEVTIQPKPAMQEPKVSRFPAFSSMPTTSIASASGKPSVPLLGQSNMRFAPAESNYQSVSSASINPKGIKNPPWEERYCRLQILLKKVDDSDQEDYIQMLRSLSAVELSKHAVELEKRTIQLSLEEAKEMQRVAILNVLGKSSKNFRVPSSYQGQVDK